MHPRGTPLVSPTHPLLVAPRPGLAPPQFLGFLTVLQRLPAQAAATAVQAGAGALVAQAQHVADADLVAAREFLLQLAPLAALEAAVRHVRGLLALLVAQAVRPEGRAGGGVAVEIDDEDDDGEGAGYGD